MNLELKTAENAPGSAGKMLADVQTKMGGFLPNLYAQMANAPAVLEAYLTMTEILGKTSFSPAEQKLILLTASARNGCKYCVAAHSSGGRMAKLDKQAIEAVRDGNAIEAPRLQALRLFTEHQMETRGKVDGDEMKNFLAAGFTPVQASEVLVGISMKALSNSFSRMAQTPLDGMLAKMQWPGNDRV